MGKAFEHQPIMVENIVMLLQPKKGGVYVDCTLGGGGHTRALFEAEPDVEIIGLDQDPQAVAEAEQHLKPLFGSRLKLAAGNFRCLADILRRHEVSSVDGLLFDLGVSSPQLDQIERGFAYQHDAPLDMRMDPSKPITAADLVNTSSQHELSRILRDYGEERWASRIAQFIASERKRGRIATSSQLVDIIKQAIPAAARRSGGHPAKRTFQALRIAVNDELAAITEALPEAVEHLCVGGRLCVISFHSLEDRLVKRRLAYEAQTCICPPRSPVCLCTKQARLRILTRKPVRASNTEQARNPRSRSALLRAAERI